jgi:hypothetical protein
MGRPPRAPRKLLPMCRAAPLTGPWHGRERGTGGRRPARSSRRASGDVAVGERPVGCVPSAPEVTPMGTDRGRDPPALGDHPGSHVVVRPPRCRDGRVRTVATVSGEAGNPRRSAGRGPRVGGSRPSRRPSATDPIDGIGGVGGVRTSQRRPSLASTELLDCSGGVTFDLAGCERALRTRANAATRRPV